MSHPLPALSGRSMMRHHQPSVEPLIFTCQRASKLVSFLRRLAPPLYRDEFLPAERGRVSRVLRGGLVQVRPGGQLRPANLRQHNALETPTGLRQPAFVISVTGSASDFLVERVTWRCGGSRKACLKSNSLFLWLASLACFPFPSRLDVARSRRRGMGEYTEAFRPVKAAHAKFCSRAKPPKQDTSITPVSWTGSPAAGFFAPPVEVRNSWLRLNLR